MPQKCEHSHWSFGHINPNRAGLVDVALERGGAVREIDFLKKCFEKIY